MFKRKKPQKNNQTNEPVDLVEFEAAVLLGFPLDEQEILLNDKIIKTPNKMIWHIYSEIFGRYMSKAELKKLIFNRKEKFVKNCREEYFSDKSYICTAYDIIHFFESKGLLCTTKAEALTYDMAREIAYVKLNTQLMFIPVDNITDNKYSSLEDVPDSALTVFKALGRLNSEKLPPNVLHLHLLIKDMPPNSLNNALNVLVWKRLVYLAPIEL